MKIIGAVAGFFLCLIVGITPMSAHAGEGHGGGEGKKDASQVQLEPFILNIGDTAGSRYAKMGISIDLSAPTLAELVKARTAPIRDAVIMIVTAKTAQDIMSAEGRMQLKDELLDRINGVLGYKAVKALYFTDFVVQ